MSGCIILVGPPIAFGLGLWALLVYVVLPRVTEEPTGAHSYRPKGNEWVIVPSWLGWACYAVSGILWIALLQQPWFGIEGAAGVILVLYVLGVVAFMLFKKG